ncbi:Maltose/maltodextrin ABC transporter, permease protein MalG [Euzebya pacifica]|uniref:Maltose/maltodextrin ABC transporter, permease protein MalG n=1 Tax=Euzebya pacifica TaxID=1608957 RepID=A0A346Y511_9ACTN|nr:carbohydrate ABC transporter permease [Euzebya pacifica]AXV09558.1 Maltose/maltodextrin ABC transporter, permease protein MalG [Euzebya pacifica]
MRTVIEKSLLLVLGLFMIFPIFWMLEASVKDQSTILANPPSFVGFEPTMDNYRDVFFERGTEGEDREASGLVTNFATSVIVAVSATVLATAIGTPAAWAYSRFPLKAGKDQLFFILSTRFMPPVVAVIPLFLMFRTLGLLDSRLGLVLLYTAFNLPFTIWMLKGFVDEIPAEYEDAAMVDGFSRVQAFRQVLLPLLRPGIFATAVFSLIFTWNEFVFAIFLTPGGGAVRTAPPAIAGLFGGTETQWGLVAASAVVFALPVLVFGYLVRNHLVAGMTFGAVRR